MYWFIDSFIVTNFSSLSHIIRTVSDGVHLPSQVQLQCNVLPNTELHMILCEKHMIMCDIFPEVHGN